MFLYLNLVALTKIRLEISINLYHMLKVNKQTSRHNVSLLGHPLVFEGSSVLSNRNSLFLAAVFPSVFVKAVWQGRRGAMLCLGKGQMFLSQSQSQSWCSSLVCHLKQQAQFNSDLKQWPLMKVTLLKCILKDWTVRGKRKLSSVQIDPSHFCSSVERFWETLSQSSCGW